jgi:hypothetical protein
VGLFLSYCGLNPSLFGTLRFCKKNAIHTRMIMFAFVWPQTVPSLNSHLHSTSFFLLLIYLFCMFVLWAEKCLIEEILMTLMTFDFAVIKFTLLAQSHCSFLFIFMYHAICARHKWWEKVFFSLLSVSLNNHTSSLQNYSFSFSRWIKAQRVDSNRLINLRVTAMKLIDLHKVNSHLAIVQCN